ncbi:zinc finger protein [Ciona intestinalis]
MKEEERQTTGFPAPDSNHQPLYYEEVARTSESPPHHSPPRFQHPEDTRSQIFSSHDDTYEEQPLCIQEDEDKSPDVAPGAFPVIQEEKEEIKTFPSSSPHQSPPRIAPQPPQEPFVIPTSREEHEDRRSSSETRSSSESRSSELQVIKEQVRMIQQQHTYQIQMIHYLHWQLNLLSQRQQQNGLPSNEAPTAPPVFNPITQLLGTNPGILPPDPARLAMAMSATTSPPFGPSDPQSSFRRASISPPAPEPPRPQHRPIEPQEPPRMDPNNEAMLRALQQHRQQQQEQMKQTPNPFVFQQQPQSSLPEQVSAMLRNKNLLPKRPDQHPGFQDRSQVSQSLERTQMIRTDPKHPGHIDNGEEWVKNQCRTCRRVLSCPSALKLHYRTHTGERPYQCDLCSRAFTTRGNLRTHYSSVHRRELPPASSSGGSSVSKRGGSAKSESHICPLCSSIFNDQVGLAQHMQMHAIVNKQQQQNLLAMKQKMIMAPPLPQVEGDKVKTEAVVDLSASGRRPPSNPSSPVRGYEGGVSEGKYRTPDKPENGGFPAIVTEQRVQSGFDALDLSSVSPASQKEEFKEVFAENGNTERYQETTQRTEIASTREPDTQRSFFPCGICLRQLESEEDLKDHLMTHDGGSSCDSPSSSIGSTSGIQEQRGENGEELRLAMKRPLEMDEISQLPDAKRNNVPRHWCNICKKQFSSASSLQIHTRTHTGEKPFICNVCSRSFTTKGNLKVHMGTHVWGAGGSRKGRRVSMDNPLMSTWMKNSTNVDAVMPNARPAQPDARANASTAAASIYQQYAAIAQGLMSRNPTEGIPPTHVFNQALAARYLQQPLPIGANQVTTDGSPEASLSSDGEQEGETPNAISASTAAHEWLWKAYQQRSQGQVN